MNIKAVFYVLIASLCYGSFPTLNKLLLAEGFGPLTLALAFNMILFPVALIYSIYKRKDVKKIKKSIWKDIFIIGFFATFFGRITNIIGVNYTSAINASILMKLTVAIVPIIAYFMLKEKFRKRKYLAMIIAFIGTFILVTEGSVIIPQIGDIIFIVLAIVISFTNVLTKKLTDSVHPFTLSSLRLTIGSGLVFLLIFVDGFKFVDLILQHTFLVVLSGFLGLLMLPTLFKGIQLSTASEATAIFLLSAPVGVILAYVFLGETISLISLFGGAILLIGCYFVARTEKVPDVEAI